MQNAADYGTILSAFLGFSWAVDICLLVIPQYYYHHIIRTRGNGIYGLGSGNMLQESPRFCSASLRAFVFHSVSMALLPFSVGLLALVSCVSAAPTDPDVALARLYAPQWRFHPDEIYWPSTVDYFLTGVKLFDSSGKVVANQPAQLTATNLDDAAADNGSGLFLSLDINAGKANFLRGQNPLTSQPDVNTFIVEKPNGIVDIYYWLFTPFNQGKSVPLVGEVGDHVGDWERMAVRTVNGVATEVDYNAHGDTGSGTIPWDEAPKFDGDSRPIGYVAKGSHGFWSTPAAHTYVNAVIFKLQDLTADGGVLWDIKDSITPLAYPDTYVGSTEWLNYAGAWGNQGETSCWWHIFYDECEIVSGPTGPLRPDVLGSTDVLLVSTTPTPATSSLESKMNGAFSHTLGTASTNAISTFSVHITAEIHTVAAQASYTDLAVQQTCTISSTDESGKDTSTTSTTIGTVSLDEISTKFIISPEACPSDSVLTSYTIGLCGSDSTEDCTFASTSRQLRAYSADRTVKGIQNTTAIIVNDLINWTW
ncbi:hypothetical protein C8J56DRAFT_539397 [Mycena floridula]|nr:hypothetical protein C8J56DRAFT_539397 [Mycena floridula]